MPDFSARLFTLQRTLGIKKKDELARRLGVSRTMLYNYEQGSPPPPLELLASLAAMETEAGIEHSSSRLMEEAVPYRAKVAVQRRIPVVGWAHAGEAFDYEELPKSWQDQVPTDCRDPKAFAVRLEGESMEPRFSEGDLLILQPSEEIYGGCLAVIKMKDDGIVFRRVERRLGVLLLIPLNPQYQNEEIPMEQVAWAYPLWGMWRQIWK